MAGTQKKLSGFDSISSIGSLPVCGKFAASVLPTVVNEHNKQRSFFSTALLNARWLVDTD